jgi:hypothetical protein
LLMHTSYYRCSHQMLIKPLWEYQTWKYCASEYKSMSNMVLKTLMTSYIKCSRLRCRQL